MPEFLVLRRPSMAGPRAGFKRVEAISEIGMRSTIRPGPKWRNWQTRRTQNPLPARACGFEPHLRHSGAGTEAPATIQVDALVLYLTSGLRPGGGPRALLGTHNTAPLPGASR